MKNPFKLIEKKSFTQLLSGNALAMMIASAGGIFIAQIYGPDAYGEYAVILAISSITGPFLTLGRELEIPQISENEISNKLASNLVANAISLGIFLGVPLIIASLVVKNASIKFLLSSAGFGLLLAVILAVFSVATQCNIRSESYRILAVRGVFQNTSLVLSQALFSIISKSFLTLVIGEIIGRAIGSLILLPKEIRRLSFKKLSIGSTFARLRKATPNWWNLLSQLLDNFTSSFLIIALTYLYGSSSGGNIALTLKIILLPIAIFGAPLGQVILARASSRSRSGPMVSSTEFIQSIFKISALGISVTIVIYFAAPKLIMFMGSSWDDSSGYIKLLSLGIVLQLLWNSFGSLYYVAKKWRSYAFLKVINFLLLIFLVLASKVLSMEIIEFLWLSLVINSAIQIYGIFQTYKFTTVNV